MKCSIMDLLCLLGLKHSSGTEIHNNLENSICDPLEKLGSLILIVSICMETSIRIQRVDNKIATKYPQF